MGPVPRFSRWSQNRVRSRHTREAIESDTRGNHRNVYKVYRHIYFKMSRGSYRIFWTKTKRAIRFETGKNSARVCLFDNYVNDVLRVFWFRGAWERVTTVECKWNRSYFYRNRYRRGFLFFLMLKKTPPIVFRGETNTTNKTFSVSYG